MKNEKISHCNIPQLMFQICMSQLNVCLWSRATGKSEGPMADFTIDNIFAMPRANGFLAGISYQQLLTRTLPPLITAWEERYALKENKHFWLRKYAPDQLKIAKAFRHPVEPSTYIQWYNGSGIYLVSQDRPGSINSVRSQWGAVDEARFIDKKKFDDEVIPTMAGLQPQFGHLWNYLSLLFCSDMPKSTKGKWLLEFKSVMDPRIIESIINVHSQLQLIIEQFQQSGEKAKERMRPKLRSLYKMLNELRRDTVYYSTANILDNIDALGLEPLRHFRRTLTELDFQVSIMNREIFKTENGFYALLQEEVHSYTLPDIPFMDSLDIDFRDPPTPDCRWEKDREENEALNISCDYNNAINCVVTAQEIGNEFRLLSSIYVENPLLLKDCVKAWHNFFKHHRSREVNYWYFATAKGGNADSDINFAEIWIAELTKLGWEVNACDMGQIGSHHSRFHFWALLFSGTDKRLPLFRYNKTNAKVWEISAQQSGIFKIGEKVKKDKSSEKITSGIPAHEATHMSEAADDLVWAMLRSRIGEESEYVDFLY